MVFSIESHTGHRENNEDNFVVGENGKGSFVMAVFDGAGGHKKGEVMSSTLADVLAVDLTEGLDIDDFLEATDESIGQFEKRVPKAASTATLAQISGKKLRVINVGDSRTIVVRKGKVVFSTTDHSWVQTLVDSGVITGKDATEEALRDNEDGNYITSAFKWTRDGLENFDVDTYDFKLNKGDVVLCFSDGLNGVLVNSQIAQFVSERIDSPAPEIVDQLIKEAKKDELRFHDNITVGLVKIP